MIRRINEDDVCVSCGRPVGNLRVIDQETKKKYCINCFNDWYTFKSLKKEDKGLNKGK